MVHEAAKPSRGSALALASPDFQTMPVRHVQSQQISSPCSGVLSRLSASGCPGMLHRHALFHLPSFGSRWLPMGLGKLLRLCQIYDCLYLFFYNNAVRGVQQRGATEAGIVY